MKNAKVQAINVNKTFGSGNEKVVAINNLNLEVEENEFTVLGNLLDAANQPFSIWSLASKNPQVERFCYMANLSLNPVRIEGLFPRICFVSLTDCSGQHHIRVGDSWCSKGDR